MDPVADPMAGGRITQPAYAAKRNRCPRPLAIVRLVGWPTQGPDGEHKSHEAREFHFGSVPRI
jgi:hypothetical protein